MHLKHLKAEDETDSWHDVVATAAAPVVHIDVVFSLNGVQSHNHIQNKESDYHKDC